MKTATEVREQTIESMRLVSEQKEQRIDAVAIRHLQHLLERIEAKLLLESSSGKYDCHFEVPNEDNQRDLIPRIQSLLHKLGFTAYQEDAPGKLFISWRVPKKCN